jgi:NitT/TauT family transport system permease protein
MKGQNRIYFQQIARRIIALSFFLLIWQLLVNNNLMYPLMFGNIPSPSDVVIAIGKELGNKVFYAHIVASLTRVFTGIFVAIVLAIPLGLLISTTKFGRDFIFPLVELVRPIPQIAWIPTAILLFPTVEGSIIYITFIGAFFPVLINTISGVKGIPAVLITAARCLGATPWQLLHKVILPGALPGIFTGITVGVGVSWMGVIAAEMISGKYGVGYYTWISYTLMTYPETIVGMITIGVLGSLCFGMIRLVEKRLIRWHY